MCCATISIAGHRIGNDYLLIYPEYWIERYLVMIFRGEITIEKSNDNKPILCISRFPTLLVAKLKNLFCRFRPGQARTGQRPGMRGETKR